MSKSTIDFPAFRVVSRQGNREALSGKTGCGRRASAARTAGRADHHAQRVGFYRCNACNEDFTVRTGTIFERSNVPLHKLVYAIYLLVTARKGISFDAARERDRCHSKDGVVHPGPAAGSLLVADKSTSCAGSSKSTRAYFGGKEANKHEIQKAACRVGARSVRWPCWGRASAARTKRAKVTAVRTPDAVHGEIRGAVEAGARSTPTITRYVQRADGLFYQHDDGQPRAGEYACGHGVDKQHRSRLGCP